MMCNLKHLTIMVSSYGTAFLTTVSRDGSELTILKEKPSNEIYRKYYCSNCKKDWKGEEVSDWEIVFEHLGTAPPEFKIPEQTEIINLDDIDLNDPNMRPTVKKQLKQVIEVFNH